MGLRLSWGAPTPAEASPRHAEGEDAESAALIGGDRLGLCQVPSQPDQVRAGSLPQLPRSAYSAQRLSPGSLHFRVKMAKSASPSGCFACGRQGPVWTRRPSRLERPARQDFSATKMWAQHVVPHRTQYMAPWWHIIVCCHNGGRHCEPSGVASGITSALLLFARVIAHVPCFCELTMCACLEAWPYASASCCHCGTPVHVPYGDVRQAAGQCARTFTVTLSTTP